MSPLSCAHLRRSGEPGRNPVYKTRTARAILRGSKHDQQLIGRNFGLNRIEAQFTALRYFALDGTDHASHKEQASMIRRYII